MKKYSKIALLIFLSAGIVPGCKKSSSAPKDYTQSIKDKTWWGTFNYTGSPEEYYSVQFNADNSLTWSQWAGNYPGHWVLDEKTLTMTFTGSSLQIKADISGDSLINITDNTSASDIKSGHLNTNTNQSLDNTVWTGSFISSNSPFQLKFMPGSNVTLVAGGSSGPHLYARTASGAIIRSGAANIFAIVTSDGEMRGSYASSVATWHLAKQ